MKAEQLLSMSLVLIANVLYAQSEYKALKVGDHAPRLTIQEWLKGDPVLEFENGEWYVVEFSGSWCPPCRKSIPHLTNLKKKYGNKFTIVSIYLEGNNKKDTTDLSYVKQVSYLMEALGDKMDFTIAVDVPQQTTKYTWGINGVPTAFVVNSSGHLAWIGHPIDLDPILKEITEGHFDADKTIQQQKKFEEYLDRLREAKKNGDYQISLHGIDSLIRVYPHKTWLCHEKFAILAGDDNVKAYAWLQWLLDNKIENFDWPHFVGSEFRKIPLANRDYEMEFQALDRTIEESETTYLRAYPLSLKAETCATMGDYRKAIEWCQQAIEYIKTPGGNPNEREHYEKDLVIYKYNVMVSEDMKKARTWLRAMVDNRKVKVDTRLIAAVSETLQPDYVLALDLVDYALAKEHNYKMYYLGEKIAIYAAAGNFTKAIELCQQVIELYADKGMPDKVEEYTNRLAEYKLKLKGG